MTKSTGKNPSSEPAAPFPKAPDTLHELEGRLWIPQRSTAEPAPEGRHLLPRLQNRATLAQFFQSSASILSSKSPYSSTRFL